MKRLIHTKHLYNSEKGKSTVLILWVSKKLITLNKLIYYSATLYLR